jgi:ABC-type bacteriocin/lantibiotic exporter with double-glycine peptidase domain
VQRLKNTPRKAIAICRGFRPLSIFVAALPLLLAVGLTGCAVSPDGTSSAFPVPAGSGKVEHVPFYSQLTYQCGPASLAGVLNFYGDAVTPDQIARAIFRENIHGTVTLDMVLYVRERGFSSRWYSGNANDIRCAVDGNVPLIVMIDLGFANLSKYHYLVVIGYGKEGVIVNSGKEREKLMRWDRFLPRWQRAKCWTLRIEPEIRE